MWLVIKKAVARLCRRGCFNYEVKTPLAAAIILSIHDNKEILLDDIRDTYQTVTDWYDNSKGKTRDCNPAPHSILRDYRCVRFTW